MAVWWVETPVTIYLTHVSYIEADTEDGAREAMLAFIADEPKEVLAQAEREDWDINVFMMTVELEENGHRANWRAADHS